MSRGVRKCACQIDTSPMLHCAVRTRRGNDTQQRSHPHQAAPTDCNRIEITCANKFVEFGASQPGGFAGFGYCASEPLREWYCIRRSSCGSLLSITLHRVVARSRRRIPGAHRRASRKKWSEFCRFTSGDSKRARTAVNRGLFDRVLCERTGAGRRRFADTCGSQKNIFQYAGSLPNFWTAAQCASKNLRSLGLGACASLGASHAALAAHGTLSDALKTIPR